MRKQRSVTTRTITLSRAWGFTVAEAERLAKVLGITDIRFVPAIRRGNGGPRVAAARYRDGRGARFCAAARKEVAA